MTTCDALDLLAAESDLVTADGLLSALSSRVGRLDVPGRLDSLADLARVRSLLLRVMARLEEPIVRAAELHESFLAPCGPPPF